MTLKVFLELAKEMRHYQNCLAIIKENEEKVPQQVISSLYDAVLDLEEQFDAHLDLYMNFVEQFDDIFHTDINEVNEGADEQE